MKLSIIGGGGVRVPLLVHGLITRGLPIDRVALFDVDRNRLALMADLAAVRAPSAAVITYDDVASCLDNADFVVTSIRVGGLAAREHDEATALAHGIPAQETIGPAGFAMAIRTIPVISGYARDIERHAPGAWVINFTNPVGMVTQAMRRAADIKAIGICDTPTELFAEAAHALGVPLRQCSFDYIGLNHLGWVRDVRYQGRGLLADVWTDPDLLTRIYARPLFPADYLARLKLLPTEYVYFYDFPDRAVANTRAAGRTRGAEVAKLTTRLFEALSAKPANALETYEEYLAERSGSYMQVESGQAAPTPPSPWGELTGYDRIAYDVMSAIVHDSNAIVPLDVPNEGSIPDLADDDIVEVPCAIGASGARPTRAGALPSQVRDLVVRVKEYERKTIDAAEAMTSAALVDALAHNPLVSSAPLAAMLVDRLQLR